MRIIWVALFILCSLFPIEVEAQNPTHLQIGEKEFGNTHIYGICEGSNGNLYVTTDNGLFIMTHSEFKKVNGPPEQVGSSLFIPQFNGKGDFFCSNLRGQIFKLDGGELKLYYQVDPKEILRNFIFFFDSSDRLIYVAREIVRVEAGREISLASAKEKDEFDHPFIYNKGDAYIPVYGDSMGYWFTRDEINKYSIPHHIIEEYRGDYHKAWYRHEVYGQTQWISNYGDVVCSTDSLRSGSSPVRKQHLHRMDATRLLLRGEIGGVSLVSFYKNAPPKFRSMFSDRFISTVHYSSSGVLYLGTFNDGIIVVPNLNTSVYPLANTKSMSLAVSPENQVYVASVDGNVYQKMGERYELFDSTGYRTSNIYYLNHPIKSITQKQPHVLYWNDKLGFEAKDLVEFDDGLLMNPTSGIRLILNKESVSRWSHFKRVGLNKGVEFADMIKYSCGPVGRVKCIDYQPRDSTLCYSDYGHTILQDVSTEKTDTLQFEGDPFMTNDLEVFDEELICGTDKNGLLFYVGPRLTDRICVENGLGANQVKKIERIGQVLYVHHANGIQWVDLKTKRLHQIGIKEGLVDHSIFDFSLSKDRLWFLNGSGAFSLELESILTDDYVPVATIDSVMSNDHLINFGEQKYFNYGENNLAIYMSYQSLIHRLEGKLRYRLLGADTTWHQLEANMENVDFLGLSSGEYTFELQPLYRNLMGKVVQYHFVIDTPFWRKWWFFLTIMTVVAVLFLIFYRIRMRRLNRKAEIINELNVAKLTAIQSQMNPHFIFNSLNSIQNLVLKGESDLSYSYLTQFANLVRRTLDYSERDRIPLLDEIRLLEVYLELEKLRFKENFEYQINYSENEIAGIRVPPMLVQPFIENALLHGLLHKTGQQQLQVNFEVADVLTCTVEDNGVGRERAKKIRERQRGDHRSFALDAIKKRFEILKGIYDQELGYQYEDLPENNEMTTRVSLRIPIDVGKEN